jgi:putative ABC transport system substrate-binding protein
MKTIFSLFLLITVAILCTPPAAAQESQKIPRIGLLSSGAPTTPGHQRTRQAFLQGLEELGYVDGKNVIMEYRYANRNRKLLPKLAAELVRLGVDVIVPSGPTAVRPAMKATKTIPIVMPNGGDPVGQGFVKTLSRPGGNVTGVAGIAKEIRGKRVELLKETLPRASRVALLVPDPKRTERAEEYAEAGKKLGM